MSRELPVARGPEPIQVTPGDAQRRIAAGAVVIDTREPNEFQAGHVAGANLLPPAQVATGIADLVPDVNQQVVVICAVGARSYRATAQLMAMGYRDIVTVAGGLNQW
jgi:rhodanese-related sulfurtransferase